MVFNVSWFVHFLLYYICWIACIYYAAHQEPYKGPLITLCLFSVQLLWQLIHQKPCLKPLYFALGLMVLGGITDTFWLRSGLIYFTANPFGSSASPLWMLCLWLSFGFYVTVNTEYWLHYYTIWGFLSLIFIPMAYWLGALPGAMVLQQGYLFYLYLGITWFFLMPLCLYLYNMIK